MLQRVASLSIAGSEHLGLLQYECSVLFSYQNNVSCVPLPGDIGYIVTCQKLLSYLNVEINSVMQYFIQ